MQYILDAFIIFAMTPVGFITIMAMLVACEYVLGTIILKDIDVVTVRKFTRHQVVSLRGVVKQITKPVYYYIKTHQPEAGV